jgi:hypothetical protein
MLSVGGILRLAVEPKPFDMPTVGTTCDRASADWREAEAAIAREAEEKARRQHPVTGGAPALNRATLDFIRDGAGEGDRHRLLFSAAANLAGFACPPALAHALLAEAGLDSGLPPKEVRRQIECGLNHSRTQTEDQDNGLSSPSADPPSVAEVPKAADLKAQLAALWALAPAPPEGPTPDALDTAGGAEERAAIRAQGGRLDAPCPPAGTRFHYQSERGRACGRSDAKLWTWEGAPRWFSVDDFPPP